MSQPFSTLENLSEEEARHLLSHGSYVGRVGFVSDGHPMILPVNYLYDDGSVFYCTASGTMLNELDGQRVAFAVDASTPLEHAGWSVIAHGTVERITDASTLRVLERGPLKSWARRGADEWFRVRIDRISGRRIPPS